MAAADHTGTPHRSEAPVRRGPGARKHFVIHGFPSVSVYSYFLCMKQKTLTSKYGLL